MTLSRRALLLGASAALGLAGCARPRVSLVTPSPSPTGPVRDQLTAMMDAYGRNTERLGMSVKDLRTGQSFEFRGAYDTQSASIAKVMIVLMALTQARAQGRELSFEDYGRASRAIIDSDNDSADALWESAGGREQYTALARDLGLPTPTMTSAAPSGRGPTPPPTTSASSWTSSFEARRPSTTRIVSTCWS